MDYEPKHYGPIYCRTGMVPEFWLWAVRGQEICANFGLHKQHQNHCQMRAGNFRKSAETRERI